MTRYTVFQNEFGGHATHSGLALAEAFRFILDASGHNHRFEQRGGTHVLVVTSRDHLALEPVELTSLYSNEIDARDDLMWRIMDGRLKSYMALPDDEFREQLDAVLAMEEQMREAVRAP